MKNFTQIITIGLVTFSTVLFAQSKTHHPLANYKSESKSKFIQHKAGKLSDNNLLAAFYKHGKEVSYNWNTTASVWNYNDSTRHTYNFNWPIAGELTQSITYYSGGMNKTIYTYNASGLLIAYLSQSWNGISWNNQWRDTYTYNAQNLQIQYLSQSWNGTIWVNDWKDIYTYNAANELTEYLSQSWNTTLTIWENDWKENYLYSGGVFNGGTYYSWNGTSWDLDGQYINVVWYQWNGNLFNSLISAVTLQIWYGTSWDNDFRYTVTYDTNANVTGELYEIWQANAWVLMI